ncbi:MAG TPA: hypothetical protein VFV65_02540 [Gemmatimonadales bacterium]|nr:hypothetical protein [Gemmatimonadales bacterium]
MRLPPGLAAALVALAACQPYTTRPAFGPLPGAAEAVVDLNVHQATLILAEALRADSIPVTRVDSLDGYLESGWFDVATGIEADSRILGDSIVRVRGWVNAYGKERGSIRVETAVRPLANPSLPPRELDRQAPADNAVAVRVSEVVAALARRYPVPGADQPAAGPRRGAPGDSTAAPGDSAGKKSPPMPTFQGRPPGAK